MDGAGEEKPQAREVKLCERPHQALPPAQGTAPGLTFEANEKQMEEWDGLEAETASATWHPSASLELLPAAKSGAGPCSWTVGLPQGLLQLGLASAREWILFKDRFKH